MFKGIVLHTMGKVAFVIGSFLIQLFLVRMLPAEIYGVYNVIINIINFNYLFLNNGVRQAVSNAITQNRYDTPNLIKRGMLYQLAIIAVVFCINFFGADFIAQIFGKGDAAQFAYYIKVAAFIVPTMGIYFVALGVFNGFKLFVIEATIITVYPLLKMLAIPFASGFIFSDTLFGAEMGFVVSGALICIISLIWLFKKRGLYENKPDRIATKAYIKSAFSFSLLFSVVAILMNLDTIILQASIGQASPVVGYYSAAVQFGKASYYLLGAFYIVVLPVVTKFYRQKRTDLARGAIRDLMTVILALVLPVTVIVAASGATALSVYKDVAYAVAGPALSFLSYGTFCMGMTLVFNMITSAADKKKFTTVMSVIMLVAFVAVCIPLTNAFSLTGTGASSLIVCAFTMLASAIYAQKIFGNFWTKKHLAIIGVNAVLGVLTVVAVAFVPIKNLVTLLLIYAALYFLGFAIMRAFKIISIKQIKNALKKEKQQETQEQIAEEEREENDMDVPLT